MARRKISIDEKIEKQKEVVFALKDKYDAALAELDALMQQKKEMQKKELLEAIDHSDKSIDEILAFVTEKAPKDESNES